MQIWQKLGVFTRSSAQSEKRIKRCRVERQKDGVPKRAAMRTSILRHIAFSPPAVISSSIGLSFVNTMALASQNKRRRRSVYYRTRREADETKTSKSRLISTVRLLIFILLLSLTFVLLATRLLLTISGIRSRVVKDDGDRVEQELGADGVSPTSTLEEDGD